jgi:hypothetical protein
VIPQYALNSPEALVHEIVGYDARRRATARTRWQLMRPYQVTTDRWGGGFHHWLAVPHADGFAGRRIVAELVHLYDNATGIYEATMMRRLDGSNDSRLATFLSRWQHVAHLFYQVRIFEWQCTSGVRRSSTISSTVPADLACEARDATRPCGPSYDDRARAAASYCACALVRRAAGVAARARVAGREVGKGQRALRHPCRFSARNADALLCCRAGFETAQWAPRGLHDVPVHKMPALRYLRQALHSLVLC